jgi:hypothetical protein
MHPARCAFALRMRRLGLPVEHDPAERACVEQVDKRVRRVRVERDSVNGSSLGRWSVESSAFALNLECEFPDLPLTGRGHVRRRRHEEPDCGGSSCARAAGCPAAAGTEVRVTERPLVAVRDLPIAGRVTRFVWRKRRYRCAECGRTFTETHEPPVRRASASARRAPGSPRGRAAAASTPPGAPSSARPGLRIFARRGGAPPRDNRAAALVAARPGLRCRYRPRPPRRA